MKSVLFVCSRNRLRSPTAEQVFADWPDLETASAGLAPDADDVLTPEHLDGVSIVFVMEKAHLRRLKARFSAYLNGIKIVCLNIPDDYEFMQPELIAILKARATPHLR